MGGRVRKTGVFDGCEEECGLLSIKGESQEIFTLFEIKVWLFRLFKHPPFFSKHFI